MYSGIFSRNRPVYSPSEDITCMFAVLIFVPSIDLIHELDAAHLLAACDHAHDLYFHRNQPIHKISKDLHPAKISQYTVILVDSELPTLYI